MAYQRRDCIQMILEQLKHGPMAERELHGIVMKKYGFSWKTYLKILQDLHLSLQIQWDQGKQVVSLRK